MLSDLFVCLFDLFVSPEFFCLFLKDVAVRCGHASFSVGGVLLAVTMVSGLRVMRSNSAWTSVKTGFCP